MRKSVWLIRMIALALGFLAVACSRSEPKPPTKTTAAPLAAHGPSSPAPKPVARPVPPYHESAAAAKPFPRLVPAAYFRNYPLVARVYQIASEIPEVIAQQPCYCYCDKFGHRSLLDCYASDHGAG